MTQNYKRRQNSSILSYGYPRPEHGGDSGSAGSERDEALVKGLESIPEAEGDVDGYLCPDGDGYLKPSSTDAHGYLKPIDSNKTDDYLTVVPSTCLDQADEKTTKVKGFSRILDFFRRGKQESDGTHSYDNAGGESGRIRRMRQPGVLHEYDNQIPGHKTNLNHFPISGRPGSLSMDSAGIWHRASSLVKTVSQEAQTDYVIILRPGISKIPENPTKKVESNKTRKMLEMKGCKYKTQGVQTDYVFIPGSGKTRLQERASQTNRMGKEGSSGIRRRNPSEWDSEIYRDTPTGSTSIGQKQAEEEKRENRSAMPAVQKVEPKWERIIPDE